MEEDVCMDNRIDDRQWHVLAPSLVIAAGITWGMLGFFAHFLSGAGLSALQITEVRCISAAAVLFAAIAVRKPELLKIHLRDAGLFIGTGVVSIAFFNICYLICIKESTLSVACTLLYTAPCFTMLSSCLIFHEKFTPRKAASTFLAFLGCVFITGIISMGTGLHITAYALVAGLCSGFAYSLYTVIGRFALRKYSWLTVIAYTFLFAAVALLPFCGPADIARTLSASPVIALDAAMLVLVSTLTPFLLYTKGLEHMETGKAALLTFVEPMVATIISALVFRESFTLNNAIGIVLIISSIIVLQYRSE